ncbi:MAG: RNA polymerase sigma factor, partial [Clostridiales bacterium]|nr:RNA polymerase sigma factor [Clostridiales bacterium]
MTGNELEKIYNEAYRAVYWTAFSLLKNEDDAQDIVQDTFIALINS